MSNTVLEVRPISFEEYETFAEDKDYDLFQSPKFYRLMQENGYETRIYGGFQDGRLVIAQQIRLDPFMKLFKSAYAPREWLSDRADDPSLVKAYINGLVPLLKKEGAVKFRMESGVEYQQRDEAGDIVPDGFCNEDYREMLREAGFTVQNMWEDGLDQTRQARWVSALDLVEYEQPENGRKHTSRFLKEQPGVRHKSVDEVFSAFTMKIPRHIRDGMKDFIIVRELADDELEIMRSLEEVSASVHNFQAPELSTFQNWKKAFGEDCEIVASFLDTGRYQAYLDREIGQAREELEKAQEELEKAPNSKKKKNKVNSVLEHLNPLEKRAKELTDMIDEYGTMIPLAAGLFVITPAETIYMFGGSMRSLSQFFGPYAVQFEMIRRTIERGALRYNFWGISGKFNPGEEGYGVFKYKKEYRAHVVEFSGEFIYPLRKGVLKLSEALGR